MGAIFPFTCPYPKSTGEVGKPREGWPGGLLLIRSYFCHKWFGRFIHYPPQKQLSGSLTKARHTFLNLKNLYNQYMYIIIYIYNYIYIYIFHYNPTNFGRFLAGLPCGFDPEFFLASRLHEPGMQSLQFEENMNISGMISPEKDGRLGVIPTGVIPTGVIWLVGMTPIFLDGHLLKPMTI